MRIKRLSIFVALVAFLVTAVGVTADDAMVLGFENVVPCRDSTSFIVTVYSPYYNNVLDVAIYYEKDDEDKLLQELTTSAFSVGESRLMITLAYPEDKVKAGRPLRIEVQLKRSVAQGYENVGGLVLYHTNAADQKCIGSCILTLFSSDLAPADGNITIRTRYGSWFRPEGILLQAMPITEGTQLDTTFPGMRCGWTVRVWYYPSTGDTTPKMLPSQYWPGEYLVDGNSVSISYATAFAAALPATAPLEEDDPFVIREGE